MKYLTNSGLSYFLNKIKTYIASQLNSKASAIHTHTSSDITDLPNGYVVDSTLDGTSSNAISNSAVSNALDGLTSAGLLPIGSYIQFAGSQAPDGFLVCNGGEISRTTYSKLFAVIGTTYGSGDGSTTFNLPNLTDRFLQGSTASGTVKNAGLPNISGGAYLTTTESSYNTVHYCDGAFSTTEEYITGYGDARDFLTKETGSYYSSPIWLDASRSNSIYGNSWTVQPPALTCLICIKY